MERRLLQRRCHLQCGWPLSAPARHRSIWAGDRETRAGRLSTRAAYLSMRAGHLSMRAGHLSTRAGHLSTCAGHLSTCAGYPSTWVGHLSTRVGYLLTRAGCLANAVALYTHNRQGLELHTAQDPCRSRLIQRKKASPRRLPGLHGAREFAKDGGWCGRGQD